MKLHSHKTQPRNSKVITYFAVGMLASLKKQQKAPNMFVGMFIIYHLLRAKGLGLLWSLSTCCVLLYLRLVTYRSRRPKPSERLRLRVAAALAL